MSKPIPNAPTMPLSFEQRLQLVKQEVENRVKHQPAKVRCTARAQYWRRWIEQNILTPPASPQKKINGDLYPQRSAGKTEVAA